MSIAFKNVEVQFSELVFGLRGVNITIQDGEFVFLVGKTGAGKSTILKLITRETRETKGQVLFHGRDLRQVSEWDIPALRRQMGIVPQDFALLPRKRVWENVAYAMRAIGATKREVRRRVPDILEMVNIGHRADAFPHELSGGEQQRVAIGRALINNPKLLIADEPTGNLDPAHSWEIMELLVQLNLRGTTVIVATHDMMVVEKMDMRIVTMDHGKVINDIPRGSSQQLLAVVPPAEPAEATPKTPREPARLPEEGAQSELFNGHSTAVVVGDPEPPVEAAPQTEAEEESSAG
ncbi:MAG: ATP-binding cassette domain-containing protein [Fimbriimonadaceae bacterium]|nr:ATP-binding cassette domain-containing protein [Fimbriimonadaceae bacterium]